jgi:hypothetical protein
MYRDRRQAFFDHALQNAASLTGTAAAYHQLVRLATGRPIDEDIILATCDFIDARNDCADFGLHCLIRLLYQFPDVPSPELAARIRTTVLDFKYWPDEPGVDSLCTWSENHQILYAAGAYLVGQLFPGETFTNAGHSGRQKMALARPRILRWLDLRFRTGFSEWLSNVYYDEDLIALLSLVDWSEDAEIQQRATMVTDLMLFDIALNSFEGLLGSTHGRSYERQKKWAAQESTAGTARLLFGIGQFPTSLNLSAPCFALSPRYRLPQALYAVANDAATYTNRQRMGIKLSEAERWGLGFEDLEDGMVYLSLEAYLHPRTAALTVRMFDAFGWWENDFFKDIARYKKFVNILRRLGLLPLLMRLVERDVCRNTREEVNFITYRTPHYMLSAAVDYRPGYGGDQQHIWQATLGPDAVCFTAHPAKHGGATPRYWAGEGTLPRVAQVKNVLVAVYRINTMPGLYLTNRLLFTHAWLPKDRFDEVVERDGWVLARKGDGYLALRSRNPYRWQMKDGQDRDREILAEGKTNVWLCELGSRDQSGSFSQFIAAICAAPLTFRGLSVDYTSPSQGRIEFGWRGPFRQNGQVLALCDFPRYENIYTSTSFPAERVEIHQGAHRLVLDWSEGKRDASRYAGAE